MPPVVETLTLLGRVEGIDRAWNLDRPELHIGRAMTNEIHIPDPTVSKEHAVITWTEGRCVLRDLGSHNGTHINGVPVTAQVVLRPGDQLVIGHVPFELRAGSEAGVPARRMMPENVSVMIPAREILKRASAVHDPLGVMNTLAAAGRLLVRARSIRETCEEFLAVLGNGVPSSRLALMLREGPGCTPEIVAARPARQDSMPSPSRAILDAVLEDGASVLAVDAGADVRFRDRPSIVAHSIHSILAVPLLDDDRVLGLLYCDSSDREIAYDQRHLELMTVLANMAAVKISHSRLLEDEERRARLQQELSTARRIQRAMLPPTPIEPGWELWAYLDTCNEVGGDLYDFWRSPSGALYVMIGDVAGKGMGAALLMASAITSARMLYDDEPAPDELARRLNRTLHHSTDAGHFVTAFIARLETATGRLSYVNAGHPRPFVAASGTLRELQGSSLPLGVKFNARYTAESATMEPGALLFMYTDGISEAQGQGDFFGTARIERRLVQSGALGCEAIAGAILDDLETFHGADHPRDDDTTLVVLRRLHTEIPSRSADSAANGAH